MLQPEYNRDLSIAKLTELLTEFNQVKSLLNQAIVTQEPSNIEQLDATMMSVCDQIVVYPAQCEVERGEKVDFLLDLLSPTASRSPFEDRICGQLRDLCVSVRTG